MKKKTACFTIIIVIMLTSLFLSGCDILLGENEQVEIISEPVITAVVGKLYEYQPDIDLITKFKVTFLLNKAPQGMTIDAVTGLISWTPTEDQIGVHEVVVRARNILYYDDQEFIVTVVKHELSSISVNPVSMSFTSFNSSKTISVTAKYTDLTSQLVENTKCIFESKNANIATVDNSGKVTSKANGSTTITVNYTEEGITKSASITVIVAKPSTGGG